MAQDTQSRVTGTAAGTQGQTGEEARSLPEGTTIIGYVDPIVGRVAHRDVLGYFGFPLIRKGETVTREILARAHSLSRLFELQAATEEE
jgi:arginine/lysine/ornithine decarboxylase